MSSEGENCSICSIIYNYIKYLTTAMQNSSNFERYPYLDIFNHKYINQRQQNSVKTINNINYSLNNLSSNQLLKTEKSKFELAVLCSQNVFMQKRKQKIINQEYKEIYERIFRSKSLSVKETKLLPNQTQQKFFVTQTIRTSILKK